MSLIPGTLAPKVGCSEWETGKMRQRGWGGFGKREARPDFVFRKIPVPAM